MLPTDKGGTKGCATACGINEWKRVHVYETGWVRSVHEMCNAFIEIVIIIVFFGACLVPTDKGGTKNFSVQRGQVWRGWECQGVLKTLLDSCIVL